MRLTGICASRGYSKYKVRVDGAAEMESRLGVELVAWRLDDGPIRLEQIRVLLRQPSLDELDQAETTFVPHAVVTIEATRRTVHDAELLVDPGSRRWEFVVPVSFGPAGDEELEVIAEILARQASTRRSRDLIVLDEAVRPETFYRGISPTHARTADAVYDGTPNEQSSGASAKVDEAEQRLGIVLPACLRELYEIQNGGYVNSVCIPNLAVVDHASYDDILQPFSGYDELVPAEQLRSVHDSFLDFGDPDDESYGSYFRLGVERMIVLAKYYQETLFLDYRDPRSVGVGFVDFDSADWPNRIVSWASFDAFFDALRHYETD